MAGEHAHDAQPAQGKDNLIPGVKHVIAVSSGKGGVGKSTVAANLACAVALTGAKVGLLDADLYGPNIPMMMGGTTGPEQKDGKILPVEIHSVKLISMGFLVPEEAPLVWRGPMVHQYLQAFFRDVLWGDLDYLFIDLPRYRRRSTLPVPNGSTGRRRHRDHTTRSGALRCPEGHGYVSKSECPSPRHHRKHELLRLRP